MLEGKGKEALNVHPNSIQGQANKGTLAKDLANKLFLNKARAAADSRAMEFWARRGFKSGGSVDIPPEVTEIDDEEADEDD